MPLPYPGDLIFCGFIIIAILIGLIAPGQRSALIGCFAVGILVCVILAYSEVFIEMGGLLQVFMLSSIAGFVRLVRRLIHDRRTPKPNKAPEPTADSLSERGTL